MLIAAMILGLVAGISYFVGGSTGTLADVWDSTGGTPWWTIAMIPVGIIGTLGGAMVRRRPNLGGVTLLFAGVSALGVGIASVEDIYSSGIGASLPYVSIHPFVGSALFLPPLIMLIVAGALALSAKKETPRDVDNVGDLVLSLVSTVVTKLRRRSSESGEARND